MKGKELSIIDLLIIVAVIAVLGAILFPVFAQAKAAQRKSNAFNLRKITRAASHYAQDFDDHIPLMLNGYYGDLQNVRDDQLTSFGRHRADLWPLIMMPYIKDRSVFVDPERGDTYGIWSGPPLATSDPGYDPLKNTFRTQNRFPMFAVNYLFLSPLMIPSSKLSDATPTNYMVGMSHSFQEAEDPANTVFYAESERGLIPSSIDDVAGTPDTDRGFFGMDAPGLWNYLVASDHVGPIIFWTGANCSGDWCGTDLDPCVGGKQTN